MLPVTSALPPTGASMPGGHAVRDDPKADSRDGTRERAATERERSVEQAEPHVLRLLRATARVFAEILQFDAARDPRPIGREIDAYA